MKKTRYAEAIIDGYNVLEALAQPKAGICAGVGKMLITEGT